MTPDLEAQLLGSINTTLGAVNGLRDEMSRRFGTVTTDIASLDAKLDSVCFQVATLETDRRVDEAVARVRDEVAQAHTLGFRWRVGIVVAASSAFGAAAVGILSALGFVR